MKKCAVLISTYNGEKYISEQIDSLLEQKNVDIDIVIRDDGSTDNTLKILKAYKVNYGDKIKVIQGSNLGYSKSFIELVKQTISYDFYFFCDQDDVWLQDKCYSSLKYIEENATGKGPLLYYSNSKVVDSKLNYICDLYEEPCYQAWGDEILFNCNGSGFTYVFNEELASLIRNGPQDIYDSHDRWLQFIARYCGTVLYNHESQYVLHRCHDSNTSNNIIGGKSVKNTFRSIISGEGYADLIANQLLEYYKEYITERDKRTLEKIKNYKTSIASRIYLLMNPKIKRRKIEYTVLLKMRVLFNSL